MAGGFAPQQLAVEDGDDRAGGGELRTGVPCPCAERDAKGKSARLELAVHLRRCYLSRMSFLTDFTPFTARATATALAMAALESTKPESCTTP